MQDLKVSPGPGSPSFVTRTFDPATSTEKLYTADANGNTLTGTGRTFVWTADNRVDSVTMGGTTTMDDDYTGIRLKKSGPLGLTIYPFAGYEIGRARRLSRLENPKLLV